MPKQTNLLRKEFLIKAKQMSPDFASYYLKKKHKKNPDFHRDFLFYLLKYIFLLLYNS